MGISFLIRIKGIVFVLSSEHLWENNESDGKQQILLLQIIFYDSPGILSIKVICRCNTTKLGNQSTDV
jgi:hypothetical protein